MPGADIGKIAHDVDLGQGFAAVFAAADAGNVAGIVADQQQVGLAGANVGRGA